MHKAIQPKGELVLRDVTGAVGPEGALVVIGFQTLRAAREAASLMNGNPAHPCFARKRDAILTIRREELRQYREGR